MEEKSRSDVILEELQRLRGQGRVVVVDESKSPFVIFTLHDGLYAFAGGDVKEILPALQIFPVPGAPGTVPGVINNRGDIEAVIDVRVVLGLPPGERSAHTRIVMTEKAGVRCGMLVDSVVDVVDLPPSSIKPPLATLDDVTRELVSGETIYRGRSVVLLDSRRIIAALRAHER